jgi:hypothetical protein
VRLPADQAWLLRAALLPGPAGRAAWRRWRAGADLATIDRGSARLLPLLWHNLLANGSSSSAAHYLAVVRAELSRRRAGATD